MKYASLGDTVYFWFAANLVTGAAGDGSSPTFAVRKAGAASSAAPTLTGTPTLLSHASFSDGSHEIAVAATSGNGFVSDAEYAVFCSLTISSVNPNGFVGSFKTSGKLPTAAEIDTQLTGSHGSGSWASSGAGSGARSVTITVNDGSDALENAKVRMTSGAESYIVSTDVNGQAVFALDDATWAVAISKPGYQFTPTTLVVNGTETQTYSMTAVSITPSEPGFVTGAGTAYSVLGEAQVGVPVYLRMTKTPTGSGYVFDNSLQTATSDDNGLVQFPGMVPGAEYEIYRTATKKKTFTVSADATSPFDLKNILGSE